MTTEILPIDIIDHILSFLRSDIASLERCAKSHPILSNISERYIYADVILLDGRYSNSSTTYLRTSEFTQILTKKPDIATHVRSLGVECVGGQRELTSVHLDGVASLLPMFTGLAKFTIRGRNYGGFPWHDIPETFCQAFLHHLRPRDIVIHNVTFFPMELLNDHRNVRISLSYCDKILYAYDTISRNTLESDPVPFEHLFVNYCPHACLEHITAWVDLHGLRSFKYTTHQFSNHLQQLLVACSNSLTTLELDTSSSIYGPDWTSFTLADLHHLTQLQITPRPSCYLNADESPSPIPGIADLVSTAPPTVQRMSIKFVFFFIGLDFKHLPDPVVVWSPFVLLAARCSSASISLHISPHFAIRDSKEEFAPGLFSPLADYKGLTPYVQSGIVTISEDYLKR